MSELLNQISYKDLDVYGRSANEGGALVHSNDYAISNSIVFYLTSRKGSYLYRPTEGGILDEILFKLNNPETLIFYTNKIKKKLKDVYRGLINDIDVRISNIDEYTNRTLQVEVYYTSIETNESNTLSFYLKAKPTNVITQNYTDVNLEGDNLLAFVVLKKEDMPENSTFIKSMDDGLWYWNSYRFTNFSESSSNFHEIFGIINE